MDPTWDREYEMTREILVKNVKTLSSDWEKLDVTAERFRILCLENKRRYWKLGEKIGDYEIPTDCGDMLVQMRWLRSSLGEYQ